MRVVIGCLAVIGLAVVLLVAGCFGLIGVGVYSVTKSIPPYATHEEISRRHAHDLAVITKAIEAQDFNGLANRVSSNVLAVFRESDEDVLGRHQITGQSYTIINKGGAGTLTANGRNTPCLVITLNPAGRHREDYHVFILDQQTQGDQQLERP